MSSIQLKYRICHCYVWSLKEWFYPPNDAYFSSPLEELQRRFSNMTAEELHELVADYKQENEALKRYIDEFNLLTYVSETL